MFFNNLDKLFKTIFGLNKPGGIKMSLRLKMTVALIVVIGATLSAVGLSGVARYGSTAIAIVACVYIARQYQKI